MWEFGFIPDNKSLVVMVCLVDGMWAVLPSETRLVPEKMLTYEVASLSSE